jgi:hypothetical protein
VEIPEEETADLAESSDCTDESCVCGEEGAHTLAISETFNEDQARALKAFLLERYHKENEIQIEPAHKPAGLDHWHPTADESSDILSLYMVEGYNLPFKVEAAYNVKGCGFLSDSELAQKQAREALLRLSLEELKLEKVWLDNLIDQKGK